MGRRRVRQLPGIREASKLNDSRTGESKLGRGASVAAIAAGLVAVLGLFGIDNLRSGTDDNASDTTIASPSKETSTSTTEPPDEPSRTSDTAGNEISSDTGTGPSEEVVEEETNPSPLVDWPDCVEIPILPVSIPTDATITEGAIGCPIVTGPYSVESASRAIGFELQQGQTVAVTVASSRSGTTLEVLDPNNQSILVNGGNGTRTERWTAAADGVYTITVTPNHDGGSYEIRLIDIG